MNYFRQIISRTQNAQASGFAPTPVQPQAGLDNPFEQTSPAESETEATTVSRNQHGADAPVTNNIQAMHSQPGFNERPSPIRPFSTPIINTIIERRTRQSINDGAVPERMAKELSVPAFRTESILFPKAFSSSELIPPNDMGPNLTVTTDRKLERQPSTLIAQAHVIPALVESTVFKSTLQPESLGLPQITPVASADNSSLKVSASKPEKISAQLVIGKMTIELITEQQKPQPLRPVQQPAPKPAFPARRSSLSFGLGQL